MFGHGSRLKRTKGPAPLPRASPSLLFSDPQSLPPSNRSLQVTGLAVSPSGARAWITVTPQIHYLRFPSADLSSIAELVADSGWTYYSFDPFLRAALSQCLSGCCIQVVRVSRTPQPLLPQSPFRICSRARRHRRQSAASPSLPTAATTTMAGLAKAPVPT
jgi:hypothetical protein